MRVASGQKVLEIGVNGGEDGEPVEGGADTEDGKRGMLLSPGSETADSEASGISSAAGAMTSPTATKPDADVADRAAAMLQGLSANSEGGLNVRRRRESADSERERRRRRRQQANSAKSDEVGLMSPSIPEEGDSMVSFVADEEGEGESEIGLPTPTTVVSPPSPDKEPRELLTPPPEES